MFNIQTQDRVSVHVYTPEIARIIAEYLFAEDGKDVRIYHNGNHVVTLDWRGWTKAHSAIIFKE